MQKTRIGLAMRAVSFNEQAAALMGVNVNRVISFTFGLGSALAAVAGIFYAMRAPGIEPLMGVQPGLRAFIAAVLGGIGNLPGAALGGIVLGLLETYFGGMRGALDLSRRHRLCHPHPDPALPPRRAARQGANGESLTWPEKKKSPLAAAVALAIGLSLCSSYFNRYYLGIGIDVGINIILAVSLNLINGHTGQFSLGHAGFMSVGGYVAAKLTLVCAPMLPAARAAVPLPRRAAAGRGGRRAGRPAVGVPTLRLRGDYLAIVTLGFGEIIRVIFQTSETFGAATGLTGIHRLTNFGWAWSVAADHGLCRHHRGELDLWPRLYRGE